VNKGFDNFLYSVKIVVQIFITGLIILMASRLILLFAFGDFNDLNNYRLDVLKAFLMGLRFDVKVMTFGLLPLALLSIGQLFNSSKLTKNSIYFRISLNYGYILILFITLVSIIDFYFFRFFKSRISILFFGILDDDTGSVLKSLWTDLPVITVALGFITYSILIYFLLRKVLNIEWKIINIPNFWLSIGFVVLFVALYFLGLRGTLRMVPLDMRYSTISNNSFINALTPNGVFSLKTAFTEKLDSKINTNIPEMLDRFGFKEPEEAITNYLGRNDIDSVKLSRNLLSTTPTNSFLASNPPNIVFILMESMNGYYLDLNNRETNLLGKLEEQLNDCYIFRNFLTSGSLTIFSLERILLGTPLSPLSQSVYQNRSISSSIAKPFKDHSYSTSFITGGELGWRNLDKFIYHQYFDNVEGEATLKKLYPDASTCEWGVNDEYLFDRILQLLKHSEGKSQFIFGFTISNHTPYATPKSYKQFPLKINDEVQSRLMVSPEIAYKNLLAYQYSNNCLGQFIESIKNSPLGNNTIIVATGDHTNHMLFKFTDKDLLKDYSVPLILYIPEKYRPIHKVNTNKFGSHNDIFPTIFNLALSNATYFNTGFNLLSEDDYDNFGIYNNTVVFNDYGCVDFQMTPLFYKWESDSVKLLAPVYSAEDSHLDNLLLKARSYLASMNYFIMSELKNTKMESNIQPKR
jgi:phosphoglycerol transferase MdoB-like AlkP superfamily enzyme